MGGYWATIWKNLSLITGINQRKNVSFIPIGRQMFVWSDCSMSLISMVFSWFGIDPVYTFLYSLRVHWVIEWCDCFSIYVSTSYSGTMNAGIFSAHSTVIVSSYLSRLIVTFAIQRSITLLRHDIEKGCCGHWVTAVNEVTWGFSSLIVGSIASTWHDACCKGGLSSILTWYATWILVLLPYVFIYALCWSEKKAEFSVESVDSSFWRRNCHNYWAKREESTPEWKMFYCLGQQMTSNLHIQCKFVNHSGPHAN